MLLAAQTVGLLGREQEGDGAVRPFDPRGGVEVARPFVPAAAVENAGFAQDHRVAHVGRRRADEVDDRIVLRPMAHRLGARPRFPRAAPGEDQPDDPVARRRRLLRAGPEIPVMKQLGAFERRHRAHDPGAFAGIEAEDVADAGDQAAGNEGRARPADPPRLGVLDRFVDGEPGDFQYQ